MLRSGPTQTPYRKSFPLPGRPYGLKIYRGVCSTGPGLRAVAVHYKTGEPPYRVVQPELTKMNRYKVRDIVDLIRSKGRLPTDQFGQILPVDDLLAWFGVDEGLPPDEHRHVRKELAEMAESQEELERLRLSQELRSGTSY